MDLGQLKKKIVREFSKSPAKTVILIALCPVALYFVVPLFLGTKPKVDDAQKAKVITTSIAPSTFLASASPSAPTAGPSAPDWRQLIRWIEADWRRTPGTVVAGQRNPFQSPAVEVDRNLTDDAESEKPVDTPAITQEALAAMGFKLTGTLVGRHSRSATINGKRYPEGTLVTPKLGGENAVAEQAVLLKHVGARHVILAAQGVRLRLELDATKLPENGITVVRRNTSPSD